MVAAGALTETSRMTAVRAHSHHKCLMAVEPSAVEDGEIREIPIIECVDAKDGDDDAV